MLHIFAEALLIAVRQEPFHADQQHRPVAKTDVKADRRWFGARV